MNGLMKITPNATQKTAGNPVRNAYFDKQRSLANAVGKEKATAYMAKSPVDLSQVKGMQQAYTGLMTPRGGSGIGKNPTTQAGKDYVEHGKTYRAMDQANPVKKGGKISTAEKNPKHKNCW